MATIGSFTTTANGFTGTIKTLNLNVNACIERLKSPSDKQSVNLVGRKGLSASATLPNWAQARRLA